MSIALEQLVGLPIMQAEGNEHLNRLSANKTLYLISATANCSRLVSIEGTLFILG